VKRLLYQTDTIVPALQGANPTEVEAWGHFDENLTDTTLNQCWDKCIICIKERHVNIFRNSKFWVRFFKI